MAIIGIGFFAALDQLQIAPTIVNTLFTGLVVLVVGSGVVAIGGGGISTMSQLWQRAAQRASTEGQRVKQETSGSMDDIRQRYEERKQQARTAFPQ